MIPPDLLRFLREDLPARQVLAYRYDHAFAIPVLTNHQVMSKGGLLTTELDFIDAYLKISGKTAPFSDDLWQGYLEKSHFFGAVMRANPVFSAAEPLDQTTAYLDLYGVDYLVVSPRDRARFERLLELRPDLFDKRYDRDGFMVLRFHKRTPASSR
jgi:hypothetical protein